MAKKPVCDLTDVQLVKEITGKYITAGTDSLLKAIATRRDFLLAEETGNKELTPGTLRKIEVIYELVQRINKQPRDNRYIIGGPEDAYKVIKDSLQYEMQENFVVLLLDTKNQVIGTKLLTKGTIAASLVDPREVFKAAIDAKAMSIIVAHNHPSGNPQPSNEDIAVTKRLCKSGDILGVPVLDHIIVGDDRYISLKEEGKLRD